jgi:hypothetical protein
MWVLIPLVVLLVIVLSVTSLLSAVVGAMGGNWPWLLIALGVFLFWKEDGWHRRRGQRERHGWTPRTVPPSWEARRGHAKEQSAASATTAKTERGAKTAASKEPTPLPVKPELPIDVQVKVEQIKRKVEVMLGYADRFPPFSKDLFIVRQTASEYLPRTVNAYLALPPETAEKPLRADGQTPHQELRAQLDLLDSKLDEIAQDMQRQDVDRLLANRQFLEDRFGRASA